MTDYENFDATGLALLVKSGAADPGLLLAQLESMWRSRIERDRFAQLDSPSADMAARLQKVYGQIETEAKFVRGMLKDAFRRPTVGKENLRIFGFRSDGDLRGATAFELSTRPGLGFALADCNGLGVTSCIATVLADLKRVHRFLA